MPAYIRFADMDTELSQYFSFFRGLFVDPFHEFVTRDDDAAAQCDGGEIPAVGYLIGVGQPDAQHMGHILHNQHQREFVKRVVFGFSYSVPFYLPGGRTFIPCFAAQFLSLLHGQAIAVRSHPACGQSECRRSRTWEQSCPGMSGSCGGAAG